MNSALYSLSRLRDKAVDALQKILLAMPRDAFRESAAWNDLYYSSSSLKSFQRRADAFLKANTDAVAAALVSEQVAKIVAAWNQYEAARLDEKARLTEKRAAVAARKSSTEKIGVDLKKHESATEATYKTLRAALEPVRISVEAHYVELLNGQLASFKADVAAAGGLAKAYIVKNSFGREEQDLPRDFTFFFEISKRDYLSRTYDSAKVRKDLKARIAARAKEAAIAEVSCFSGKLAGKIDRDANGAKLVSAKVSGSNLWNRSSLKAVLDNGAEQVWNTQIIWNRSYLGTEFNQWPTRRAA
jgi:hypothetical protein